MVSPWRPAKRALARVFYSAVMLRHSPASLTDTTAERGKRNEQDRDGNQRRGTGETFVQVLRRRLLERDGEKGWKCGGGDRRVRRRRDFRCRWRHLCCFSPGWCPRTTWGHNLPRRFASSLWSNRPLCPPLWCITPVAESVSISNPNQLASYFNKN